MLLLINKIRVNRKILQKEGVTDRDTKLKMAAERAGIDLNLAIQYL
jgi:hypothetical protein